MPSPKFHTYDTVLIKVGKYKGEHGEVRGYDLSRRSYLVKVQVNGHSEHVSCPVRYLERVDIEQADKDNRA